MGGLCCTRQDGVSAKKRLATPPAHLLFPLFSFSRLASDAEVRRRQKKTKTRQDKAGRFTTAFFDPLTPGLKPFTRSPDREGNDR